MRRAAEYVAEQQAADVILWRARSSAGELAGGIAQPGEFCARAFVLREVLGSAGGIAVGRASAPPSDGLSVKGRPEVSPAESMRRVFERAPAVAVEFRRVALALDFDQHVVAIARSDVDGRRPRHDLRLVAGEGWR